ncbi:MAG: hypothetical protein QXG70_00595 [Candidatus Methanomethylicaceae archaeon]
MEKILESIKKVEEEIGSIESKGRSMAREIITMAEEGARRIESLIEKMVKEKGEEILAKKKERNREKY